MLYLSSFSRHHCLCVEQQCTVFYFSVFTCSHQGNNWWEPCENKKKLSWGKEGLVHDTTLLQHGPSVFMTRLAMHERSRVSMTTQSQLTHSVQDEKMWSGKLIENQSKEKFKQHAQSIQSDIKLSRSFF